MPSDLPTTFSRGLFYLEALDYAGFDGKCSIDEVFNLIATSSEFMNSAILPQFVMKRDYFLSVKDVKFPFSFCKSLFVVRTLNVNLHRAGPKETRHLQMFEFLNFLEQTQLFNSYLKEVSFVGDDETQFSEIADMVKHGLHSVGSSLETLRLFLRRTRSFSSSPLLLDELSNQFSVSLLNLHIDFTHAHGEGMYLFGDTAMDISALRNFKSIRSLTLWNRTTNWSNERQLKVPLDWLADDVALCHTLRRLELQDMEGVVPSYVPLANLRSLNELVIVQGFVPQHSDVYQGRRQPERHMMKSREFGAICDAVADSLTCLKMHLYYSEPERLAHLSKLKTLRFLDLGGRGFQLGDPHEPTLLDVGILPCFGILIELKLSRFTVKQSEIADFRKYLQEAFSHMRCLKVLHFEHVPYLGFSLDSLDYLHPHSHSQLREVKWTSLLHSEEMDLDPRGFEVLSLPKNPLPSVEKLKFVFASPAEYRKGPIENEDQTLRELKRLPLVFPNLTTLELDGELYFPFDHAFIRLQRLQLGNCHGFALRSCFDNKVFPELQHLYIRDFEERSEIEKWVLLREIARLTQLKSFGVSRILDAGFASLVRFAIPNINYDLDDDAEEKKIEWKHYRNRRKFFDKPRAGKALRRQRIEVPKVRDEKK